jgi:hypothetical protein
LEYRDRNQSVDVRLFAQKKKKSGTGTAASGTKLLAKAVHNNLRWRDSPAVSKALTVSIFSKAFQLLMVARG